MKKTFLTFVALCATTLNLQAQQTTPANEMTEAAAIVSLLQSINQKLDALEKKINDVEKNYSQNFPDHNGVISHGHEYVDMGLMNIQGHPVYWATCNMGADKPEDAGLYFAWGETVGYDPDNSEGRVFDWANYKWCNGTFDTITKYCIDSTHGTVDDHARLDPEDDAATQNWGSSWYLPTEMDWEILRLSCTWTWDDEKNGFTVTSPRTGNSIFLPAAGYCDETGLHSKDWVGGYWSNLIAYESYTVSGLYFDKIGTVNLGPGFYRAYGRPIRPVYLGNQ